MNFVSLVYQVEGYQNILKLSCVPFAARAFTSYKAFLKSKKRFGISLLALNSA